MVEEGWYTDPQDSARLRYWDGAEWTEHTHDRPDDGAGAEAETAAASGEAAVKARPAMRWSTEVRAPAEPAPPPPPPPAPIQQTQPLETYLPPTAEQQPLVPEPEPELGMPDARLGQLNDIGQWLGRTFRVGLAKVVPCAVLVALGLVPVVFFYAVAYLALSEITDDGGLRGTTVVMVVVLGFLYIVWMLWLGVVTLAQNHLLYQAHLGGRTSIGRSLQAGLQGVGRLAWAYLTLLVYAIVVVAVGSGLTFLFSLVSDTLGEVFFVVAYAAVFALTLWLGVKLIFLLIAAAVAPPGDRPMVVSVETTDGYFWPILGRVMLLGLILSSALLPVMLTLVVLIGASGVFVNDPGSGTATALIGTIAAGGVLYFLMTLAVQVFSTSGIVRLYVDLGGPAQVEQTGEQSAV